LLDAFRKIDRVDADISGATLNGATDTTTDTVTVCVCIVINSATVRTINNDAVGNSVEKALKEFDDGKA
jgi:hypothetical protein